MTENFIRNEHYNYISKQAALMRQSTQQHLTPAVRESLLALCAERIMTCIPRLSEEQKQLLDFSSLRTNDQYDQALSRLDSCRLSFPEVTEPQLKKLFPKRKKLKLPALANSDLERTTYLSWVDSRSNRMYLLYVWDGRMEGIECTFSPNFIQNTCSICHHQEQVTMFSTVTKERKANNPDYYRAIGNLICTDSAVCNRNITDTEPLDRLFKDALTK
ncbi:elongation factor G-binding protein [Sporosarcina sp. NCCP-2716]|uniref:FusB/FusC family EF-G-binding protein n=1 Tax=Sporosarcina sp. NCCP-2716 TaxID=2943679 RepID=UPI00203A535D|nr:FusB/FusC family EF-G-binding protein [Sporosarcina sp. NCCP-2716]GKV69709.1 elongation factor G-binding protein [Sporosarcina sp. NCCP-2716]